jgi:hypothetical protein
MGDQNTQQISQNPMNQLVMTEKWKKNYLSIVSIVLICFVVFGFGGYYFGKQSLKISDKTMSLRPILSPTTIIKENRVSNLKTYKNIQYGIEFNYPQNYIISVNQTISDDQNYVNCIGLTNNKSGCLLSLTIDPTNNDYTPKGFFLLLKGINSVTIPGQVSSINFDPQKKAWVVNNSVSTPTVLSVWGYTKTGQEIIKSSNGGSHGSSYYYIISNYENDEVAIFSIPKSYRLRCDNFENDKPKEAACNNFYKSVINQYNNGQITTDTWLPENYINSIYSEAENMVRSYREVVK